MCVCSKYIAERMHDNPMNVKQKRPEGNDYTFPSCFSLSLDSSRAFFLLLLFSLCVVVLEGQFKR